MFPPSCTQTNIHTFAPHVDTQKWTRYPHSHSPYALYTPRSRHHHPQRGSQRPIPELNPLRSGVETGGPESGGYHCISDGNQLFSETFGCHFHFILNVMSDKAAFVRGALFCVQCYQGNLALSPAPTAPPAGRVAYAATNSISLWDYGINKFNCITVSLQFVL